VVPHRWGTRLGVWCKWSCPFRQLVVPHRWGTRLGVWCKWSCLSTAGGTPLLGYPAGVWTRPPAQADPPREGEAGRIDVAFPLLSLGAHPDCQGRTSRLCVVTSTDSTAGDAVQLDTSRTCSSRGREVGAGPCSPALALRACVGPLGAPSSLNQINLLILGFILVPC
jgi:hypothetical protein